MFGPVQCAMREGVYEDVPPAPLGVAVLSRMCMAVLPAKAVLPGMLVVEGHLKLLFGRGGGRTGLLHWQQCLTTVVPTMLRVS